MRYMPCKNNILLMTSSLSNYYDWLTFTRIHIGCYFLKLRVLCQSTQVSVGAPAEVVMQMTHVWFPVSASTPAELAKRGGIASGIEDVKTCDSLWWWEIWCWPGTGGIVSCGKIMRITSWRDILLLQGWMRSRDLFMEFICKCLFHFSVF